jgi:uncharacterized alpha-E superfamily protein
MNRHLERAENYARFMDVNFNLSLELPLMKYSNGNHLWLLQAIGLYHLIRK